ncbi:MAG: VWA domain-containing protein [bacterium]|nr:VWA domain-containing protein [bacterium]
MTPTRRTSLVAALLVSGLLLAPLTAQRPKTAEEAMARFDRVKRSNENARRRAAGDLGKFDDPAVTRTLLEQLRTAESSSYRQTLLRALGGCARPEPDGVVTALQEALVNARNPRIADTAGAGLAAQGTAGIDVLGEILRSSQPGVQRTAACRGLEHATGDQARDFLLDAIKRSSGSAILPPLEALENRDGDPAIDAVRVRLAGGKYRVAAAKALAQLARHNHPDAAEIAKRLGKRLAKTAGADLHAAVLHGLLRDPVPEHHELIVGHAIAADAAFGKRLTGLWQRALAGSLFDHLNETTRQHKDAARRAIAAKAMRFAPTERHLTAARALTGLLQDRDDGVVAAAAAALPTFGKKLALPALIALIDQGRDAGKAAGAIAIHEFMAEDGGWHGLLLGHAQSKHLLLRTTALGLLGDCGPKLREKALGAAEQSLSHGSWQVRAAAIDLLVALREKAGVPLLIERLSQERARLHSDVTAALHELTRQRFPDQAKWRDWWQREAERFRVPARADQKKRGKDRGAAAATTATYWDLPVHSDRLAFVVDTSGSMRRPFGTAGTRLDEAKRQLKRVLDLLPNKAKANIIRFSHDASAWNKKLKKVDKRGKKTGAKFTDALESRGPTDLHAGLELAFADPEVDTIYVLTDGRPSAGQIIDRKLLAAAVKRWNASRCIRIHTVAIGESSKLLEQLAKESGGLYTVAR